MPRGTKVCRVCGKTYTECNVTRHFDGNFHWREVSCSPECGEIYLQKVIEARAEKPSEETTAKKSISKKMVRKPSAEETPEPEKETMLSNTRSKVEDFE